MATKNAQAPPPSPQTWHNQEHSTIGFHFISFEMALGPLWLSAVPNKYIRRGARREKTNPKDNVAKYPRRVRGARAVSGAPPEWQKKKLSERHQPVLAIRCPLAINLVPMYWTEPMLTALWTLHCGRWQGRVLLGGI